MRSQWRDNDIEIALPTMAEIIVYSLMAGLVIVLALIGG